MNQNVITHVGMVLHNHEGENKCEHTSGFLVKTLSLVTLRYFYMEVPGHELIMSKVSSEHF